MPALNDARFASLRGQGHTGANNDMVLKWLQANGATARDLPGAWRQFLSSQGFTGHRNEAWFALLGSRGYTGSLNDRELKFWLAGGVVSADGVRITGQPSTYSGLEFTNSTFTVTATSGNASPLSYQWQERIGQAWSNVVNGGRVSGATTATLTVSSIPVVDNGRLFRCQVTNSFNTVTSEQVMINITGAFWFLIDQLGNRMIDEPMVDLITDERSL